MFRRRGWSIAIGLVVVKLIGAVASASLLGVRTSLERRGPLPVLTFEVSDRGFARITAQSTLLVALGMGLALLIAVLSGRESSWIAAWAIGVVTVSNMALVDQVLTSYLRGVTDVSTVRWTFVVLVPAWLLASAWVVLQRPYRAAANPFT